MLSDLQCLCSCPVAAPKFVRLWGNPSSEAARACSSITSSCAQSGLGARRSLRECHAAEGEHVEGLIVRAGMFSVRGRVPCRALNC